MSAKLQADLRARARGGMFSKLQLLNSVIAECAYNIQECETMMPARAARMQGGAVWNNEGPRQSGAAGSEGGTRAIIFAPHRTCHRDNADTVEVDE